MRICKNIEKTLVFTVFCKGRPLEKQQQISKKSMKNLCKFRMEKKRSRSHLKSRFGRVLGSIWPGFGAPWAGFGPLLGALCLLFGRSKRYLFKALVQDKLQEAFWMDSGLLLEGFGKVLEGFREVFGRIWEDLGGFESFYAINWQILDIFY